MELRRRIIPIMYAFALVFTMLSVQPQATQAEILGLQPDSPENVEMLQQPLDDLDGEIEEAISEKVMPGAIVLIDRYGKVVKHDAYGYASGYVDVDVNELDMLYESL